MSNVIPSTSWKSICMDSFKNIAVCATGNYVYVSSNGLLTEQTLGLPSQAIYTSICCNSSGTQFAVCAANYGPGDSGIWSTSNLNNGWTSTGAPSDGWSSICSSSSGDFLAACVLDGNIYISNNGGSWTSPLHSPTGNWYSICCSSSGQYLAVCESGGFIYTSSDTGGTWGLQTNAPSANWSSICISSLGQYIFACINTGGIWKSSNYGNSNETWVHTPAPSANWQSICCSSTGQHLAACINVGGIYTSSNYGETWVQSAILLSLSNLDSICCDSTGQYLAVCVNPGYVYTSKDYGVHWELFNQHSFTSSPIFPSPTAPSPTPSGNPPSPSPLNSSPTPIVDTSSSSSPSLFITTSPNPIVAGQPATITYQSSSYLPIPNNNYVLKNSLDVTVSSVFSVDNSNMFTFTNVYLITGLNILYIYNLNTTSMSPTFNLEVSSVCFREGTKILCYNKGTNDKYLPIEQLNETVYVKTHKHGYKKLKYLIKTKMINSSKKTINKLYKMKKSNNNELIEDLYVTGSHALLKDKLTEKEEKSMNKLLSVFKDVNYKRMIDDKHKILACFDTRFDECNEEGYFNIYHIVLEDDKGVYKNYGIYANGILAESTMENTLSKLNDYDLINIDKTNISIDEVTLPKSIKSIDIFRGNPKAKKYLNNSF